MSESKDQCSRSIEERLMLASRGGCTCGVKTFVLEYHDDLCHYRIFEETKIILALKDERIDVLKNMLSTVLHEWVPSDEPMYHDAVKLLEGSGK